MIVKCSNESEYEALARKLETIDTKIPISPFDIGAEEIDSNAFSHPEMENVVAKIGFAPGKKEIYLVWVYVDLDRKENVVLTMRPANKREIEYYRSAKTNA